MEEPASGFGRVVLSIANNFSVVRLYESEVDGVPMLVLIRVAGRSGAVHVGGPTADGVEARVTSLVDQVSQAEAEQGKVPVTFWSGRNFGANSREFRITAPAWGELEADHTDAVISQVAPVMAAREPGPGRLLLWHGPPGTGKTHAIRALAREWRDWCSTEVISDPEKFLESTDYMLEVLSSEDQGPGPSREWKLIVLEDAGQLLAADARRHSGRALSRLLNLTDGLPAQGMNGLVLVTTNEPLSKLDPALNRPGRCWAEIEFECLPVKQANEWLAGRGSDHRVTRRTPVAELYALLHGQVAPRPPKPAIGFGGVL